MELKLLKTYIEINLASNSIRLSKFYAGTPILFLQNKSGSLYLYINYQGFNNLTIKNCYPLCLISELLDHLDHAKYFTQLDITNAYYQIKIQKHDK